MLEPTLSLITIPRERPRRRLALAGPRTLLLNGWIAAAPFLCAAVWAAATGVACLVSMATGQHAPLDWLRSGNGLIAVAALTAAAVGVASLMEGMPTRVGRAALRQPSSEAKARPVRGWLLEEGRFTPV